MHTRTHNDGTGVFVATGTFAALMAGGMFSFIWANLLYPEGPTVMHLQDGVLAAGVAASTPACMFIDPVGMMLVGAGGTLVATLSFRFIQPKIADQDTQGVSCHKFSTLSHLVTSPFPQLVLKMRLLLLSLTHKLPRRNMRLLYTQYAIALSLTHKM